MRRGGLIQAAKDEFLTQLGDVHRRISAAPVLARPEVQAQIRSEAQRDIRAVEARAAASRQEADRAATLVKVTEEWISILTEFSQAEEVTPRVAVRFREFAARATGKALPYMDYLGTCPVVIWHQAIWDAAQRGFENFVGTICPRLERQGFYLWLGSPFVEQDAERETTLGFYLTIGRDAHAEQGSFARVFRVKSSRREGEVIRLEACADLVEGEPLTEEAARFAAGLWFLDLEWVGVERKRVSRQQERTYLRQGKPVPEINEVVLRRAYREPREGKGGDSAPREYSCSWVVSGHWRNQFYPSTGEHAPKYINPYPKGPVDKPLRARPTVYVAKR